MAPSASSTETKTATEPPPEPWLRGPLPGVPPFVMPVFFSFAQVREDLARHLQTLDTHQLWQSMPGGSLGYHLKHLAGSVDRLTTYLFGNQLTPAQLQSLEQEAAGDENLAQLLAIVDTALSNSEHRLRTVDGSELLEPRFVGRKKLPTTVLGLLVHLAEHTQRHLGQCITLAHMLRRTG